MLCFSAVAFTAFTENLAICFSFQISFHFFAAFTVQCLTTVMIDTIACVVTDHHMLFFFLKIKGVSSYFIV